MANSKISLITGPMFAGKTTELLSRISTHKANGLKCLLIKYNKDERYGSDVVQTHDKVKMDAISCNELAEVSLNAEYYDVIGVDEGQFFEDIAEFSEKMANKGKEVIIAALSGTFERKNFAKIPDLLPIAEEIVKLSADCSECPNPASFTLRKSQSKETVLIGGSEVYKPVCRTCYLKNLKSQKPVESINKDTRTSQKFNSDYVLGTEKDIF
ncbi:unnamed protein product [Moneuplotes crassus]|uniref:Thymidine kinase n=1 Tax=Euplotes crassus TaxID=5936 RepID=A0AAD2D5X6_EUPCR|nr:unnamed protein product [Moneuplotes crassus]